MRDSGLLRIGLLVFLVLGMIGSVSAADFLEGFEDGDMSEYNSDTSDGDNDFVVQSTTVFNGSWTLNVQEETGSASSINRSHTESNPPNVSAYLRSDCSNGNSNIYFGLTNRDSGAGYAANRAMFAQIKPISGGSTGSGYLNVNGVKTSFNPSCDTKYFIELKNIDWSNYMVGEVYVDNSLITTDVPFENNHSKTTHLVFGTYEAADAYADNIRLVSGNTNPVVDSTSTTPKNWTLGSTVDVSANITDSDGTVQSVEAEVYHNSNLIQNTTKSYSNSSITANFVDLFNVTDTGNYTVYLTATDDTGATTVEKLQQNVSDITRPAIQYNPSSTSSGTYKGQDWVFVNVTSTDNYNLSKVQVDFDGTNQTFSTVNGDNYWRNFTGLSPGSYTVQAWANDTAGNYNFTGSRTVTLENILPNVTLPVPDSDPVAAATTVNLTVNASDQDGSINTPKINLTDAAGNLEIKNAVMNNASGSVDLFYYAYTPAEEASNIGDWTANISVTDSDGGTGSSSAVFTVEDVNPPVTSDNWTATGYVNQSFALVELAATDAGIGLKNISYRVDGGSYVTTSSNTTVNITSDGNHTLEYNSTDKSGNVEAVKVEYVALDTLNISKLVYATSQNTSYVSNLSTQFLYRNKEVVNHHADSESNISVSPPSVPGVCSDCNNRTVDVAGNQRVNLSYNSKGDFITESEFRFIPTVSEVTLGVNYTGKRALQLANSEAVGWTGLDVSGGVTSPKWCGQNNNSAVSLAASSTSNYTIGFSCSPGVEGSPVLGTNGFTQNSTNYTQVWYNTTDLQVYSNETEESRITWKISKASLEKWNDRNTSSVSAIVDGKTNNVTVTDDSSYVYMTVGTNFGNSSLHEGTHTAKLGYYYMQSSSSSSTSTSSSGGGGLLDDSSESVTAVEFEVSPVALDFGERFEQNFTLVNRVGRSNTVNVLVPDTDSCTYVEVRKSLSSREYGKAGVYTLQPNETVSSQIRVSLPENVEGRVAGYSCSLEVSTSYGSAGEFTVTVSEENGFCRQLEQLGLQCSVLDDEVTVFGSRVEGSTFLAAALFVLLLVGMGYIVVMRDLLEL